MFSKEYLKELQSIHGDVSRPRGFGGKAKNLGKFYKFLDKWQPKTLLDYGCGKGYILANIRDKYPNIKCQGYDPAVPMFSNLGNEKFDCIFSNDVLEHIEPDYINSVLGHINNLSIQYIWLRIDTKPARKKLTDGRNAHLILEDEDWWLNKIREQVSGNIIYSELTSKGKFDVAIEK